MDYHVYSGATVYAVKHCATEKAAREYVAKARHDWAMTGAPRVPSYQIIWNRDGRVIASFPVTTAAALFAQGND